MPCLLLSSLLLLVVWPLLRAGQWLADAPWWACLLVPAALALALSLVFKGLLWACCRYSAPESPLHRQLARLEDFLDGASYGWMFLPAGVVLGLAGLLAVVQGGAEAVSTALPPLLLAWLALADRTRPAPLPPDPLPVPLDDSEPPFPESGKEVVVRWSASLEGSAPMAAETLLIPHEEYQEFREKGRHPRRPLTHYGLYVSGGLSPTVRRLARRLRRHAYENGLDALREAACAVRLAREIPYESDSVTRDCADWADYPVELLYDQRGDCEDHAILAAALLHYLGHRVALYWIELEENGHIALAYAHEELDEGHHLACPEGQRYFYVETVPTDGNGFGDLPSSFLGELKASSLIPIPANA